MLYLHENSLSLSPKKENGGDCSKQLERVKSRKMKESKEAKHIQKLNVTKVSDIILEEADGVQHTFNSLYTFHHFLGTGSFGFVVKAEKKNGQVVALKVS
jgi:hypothetical protein